MPNTHALLSPSSAHRWLNCTAAPLLEAKVEDKGSDFAKEGTLAHAYCAMKLKQFLHLPTSEEEREIEELNDTYHTGEMDEYTDTYKTLVLEKLNKAKKQTSDAQLLVETRLDFSKYVPASFGTSDAIIIADGVMDVIDFKYGKGVEVSAVDNPQMMVYALGAWEAFNMEYNITHVRMTIIQPRIDNLSEFEMPVSDLRKWATYTLAPKAKEAMAGGEPKAGEWCKFCKVKGRCRVLAEACTSKQQEQPDPKLMSTDEIAKNVLPLLPLIKSWLSSIEEYTLEQALSGVHYDGYKIVEGRSIRRITDPDKVIELLEAQGYTKETIIKPTELRSLTDLEKLIGKKAFNALCKDYIVKPQGKPTLVTEADKRPAMNQAEDDFKDF